MRSSLRITLVAVPLALCTSCAASAPPPSAAPAGQQSYLDAVKMICDVDQLAGLSQDEDLLGVGQKRSEWLGAHIENPDGIYLRTVLSVKPAEEQAVELRKQAQKTGLPRCALAASIEQAGTGGLSP